MNIRCRRIAGTVNRIITQAKENNMNTTDTQDTIDEITGNFVGQETYEEFRRFQESRHSFATAELSDEQVKAMGESRMDSRHARPDALLDPK
jgi:hypothetical protein